MPPKSRKKPSSKRKSSPEAQPPQSESTRQAQRHSDAEEFPLQLEPLQRPASDLQLSGRRRGREARRHGDASVADLSNEPPRKRRNPRRAGEADVGVPSAAESAEAAAEAVSPRFGGRGELDSAELDPEQARDISRLGESVVKVFCVHSEPNYSLPWQRKRQISSSGSGFMLPHRRILTNAHCVDHHSQIKVRRRGSDTKFVATVLAMGTECDIAMLTVKDEAFWEGVESVRFGTLPYLQDAILVIGYPIGGDSQSVTSGVVSRIEVTAYVHGSTELLGMQIDAAINSGNSGGPAFNSAGECVGIAFQSMAGSGEGENIGYVIPPPVIQHFIEDFEANGRYTGFPALGIEWQKLESPAMQKALGMQQGQKGVLVRRIEPTVPAAAVLKKGDVLLRFDDTIIGVDGTVPFRSGERINFSYLISQKQNDEQATLRIMRGGKESTVSLQLVSPRRLVPSHIKGAAPSYFIHAGLVFTQVTVPYLRSEYGKDFEFDAPVKILDRLLHGMAEKKSEQIVVVGQVLAADVNIGYESIVNTQLLRVNDVAVSNLQEVVLAVEACEKDYLTLDLDYDQLLILSAADARTASPEILEMHGIPHDRSADLRPTT